VNLNERKEERRSMIKAGKLRWFGHECKDGVD